MPCTPSLSHALFHQLRRARALAALALAWWMLSLAAAVIAPTVSTSPADAPLHQLCSALGVQQSLDQNHTAPSQPSGSGWHCVLCLGGTAPLAPATAALLTSNTASPFARACATPALYSRHAGPAPARGPPGA